MSSTEIAKRVGFPGPPGPRDRPAPHGQQTGPGAHRGCPVDLRLADPGLVTSSGCRRGGCSGWAPSWRVSRSCAWWSRRPARTTSSWWSGLRQLGDVTALEARIEDALEGVEISDRCIALRSLKRAGHLNRRAGPPHRSDIRCVRRADGRVVRASPRPGPAASHPGDDRVRSRPHVRSCECPGRSAAFLRTG